MQVFRLFDTYLKLKMPNKINYLVLLINKKKTKKQLNFKQFAGISSSKGNCVGIMQLQDDGTFLLCKKPKKKIVITVIDKTY